MTCQLCLQKMYEVLCRQLPRHTPSQDASSAANEIAQTWHGRPGFHPAALMGFLPPFLLLQGAVTGCPLPFRFMT